MPPVPLRRVSDSPDFHDRLAFYVRVAADSLGLRDYEVELERKLAQPGRIAEAYLSPFRQKVALRVCEDFADLEAEEQRHAVVHELVHAHARALSLTVDQVERWMPPDTWAMFKGMYERDVEVLVDALAVLLCALVELPDVSA